VNWIRNNSINHVGKVLFVYKLTDNNIVIVQVFGVSQTNMTRNASGIEKVMAVIEGYSLLTGNAVHSGRKLEHLESKHCI